MRAVVAAVLLVVACDEPTPPCGECIAEPRSYCVLGEDDADCQDDADCAAGFSCLKTDAETQCDGPAAAVKRCRWERQDPEQTALTQGFAARFMFAELVQAVPLQVRWEAPPTALYVACALFTCNPAIRRGGGSPVPDETIPVMANAAACVAELHVVDSSRSSLAFGGPSEPITGTCAPGSEPTLVPALGAVTIGCWAYDTFQIVAATDLLPVDPRDFAALSPHVPTRTACQPEDDDERCFDMTVKYFGVCRDGVCRPRCVSPQDCERIATIAGQQPPASGCDWTCEPVANAHGKVCVPRS